MRQSALALVLAAAFAVGSCATTPSITGSPSLVGTEWRLDHFQSSDDGIGTLRPNAGEVYTLRLDPDGSLAMALSCNRATGRWTSPDAAAERGSITLEGGAMTMAACAPSPMDRLSADLERIRSFVIADGRLHLNLMMDGGNYVWLPNS